MNIIKKMFGTHSERELKRIYATVDKIEALRPSMQALSDEELQEKTREYKNRLEKGKNLKIWEKPAFPLAELQVFCYTIFSRNYYYEKERQMYLDYNVDIPDVKGKITYRTKGNARYVYYECNRIYDPSKKYTTVKRVTIGKVSDDDGTKMRPNENFRKFFPEVDKSLIMQVLIKNVRL